MYWHNFIRRKETIPRQFVIQGFFEEKWLQKWNAHSLNCEFVSSYRQREKRVFCCNILEIFSTYNVCNEMKKWTFPFQLPYFFFKNLSGKKGTQDIYYYHNYNDNGDYGQLGGLSVVAVASIYILYSTACSNNNMVCLGILQKWRSVSSTTH